MNRHYDAYLTKKYPMLYKNRFGDLHTTAMCWGFDHGDGWFRIILNLSEVLTLISDKYRLDITVNQVKEKYGTLRFYYGYNYKYYNYQVYKKFVDKLVTDIVRQAEIESSCTCEICGKQGKLRETGWIQTLCEEHYKKWQDTKEKTI